MAQSTPIPVALATPLSVHIADHADAWAVAGTIAAICAAVAALITLLAVLRQIKIANEQIEIAREEVGYVKQDLEMSRQQLREIVRRPSLYLTYGNGKTDILYIDDVYGSAKSLHLPLRLTNDGQRATRGWQVVLFFPEGLVEHVLPAVFIDGEACVRVICRANHVLYPGDHMDVPSVPLLPLLLKQDSSYLIHYRVYDDFGSYPSDEDYGTITLRTAWLAPNRQTKGFQSE